MTISPLSLHLGSIYLRIYHRGKESYPSGRHIWDILFVVLIQYQDTWFSALFCILSSYSVKVTVPLFYRHLSMIYR